MSSDPSSNCFKSDDEACVSHYALHLAVDFGAHVLRGHCDCTCTSRGNVKPTQLVLDTNGLTIHSVCLVKDGTEIPTHHALDEVKYQALGRGLRIPLPEFTDEMVVRVKYSTSPDASALQWLTPPQTKSGKHPYLFSQCQAIHARSMLPCQDSPSNKASYRAVIQVPKPLVCVMSAVSEATADFTRLPFEGAQGEWVQYQWYQKVPIATYLIAITVGELESRDLSPRCRVWAEPSVVDAGAWEFAETEQFLQVAEDICGEYRWGRYDLLILPPSFPYGGMENPCLTFVTPTLIAGDRSLTNVVAHEIAHSWSGNLVTNRTWECFWMNEGFTVFVERKIHQRMYGDQEQGLQCESGWGGLCNCVASYGPDHSFTALTPHLEDGADPDDAFSRVPYEKGFAFVCHLEQLAGGAEAFAPFLKSYFDTLAYKHTDPPTLRTMYTAHFPDAAAKVDWERWLNAPGLPAEKPQFDGSRVTEAKALAERIIAGGAPAPADVEGWTTSAHIVLLEVLEAHAANQPLPEAQLEALGTAYAYNTTKNAEIRMRFDLLGLRSAREANITDALDLATSQGRMKFTRVLFKALKPVALDRARDAFRANEQKFHPICAKMVAKDLEV